MFKSNELQELKYNLNTVLVAEQLGLHPVHNGKNYWVVCPFHKESQPSMVLYQEGNRGYFCHGCGKSGDAIDLYIKVRNISFNDAIKELTDRYRIFGNQSSSREFFDYSAKKAEERKQLNNLVLRYKLAKNILSQYKIEDIVNADSFFFDVVQASANLEYQIDQLIYNK